MNMCRWSLMVVVSVLVFCQAALAANNCNACKDDCDKNGYSPLGSNHIGQHSSYGPTSSNWTNGNNSQYMEGETAVMALEIKSGAPTKAEVNFCLDVLEGNKYAFAGFSLWNSSYMPTSLPGNASIAGFATNGLFGVVRGTINQASTPTKGAHGCSSNQLGIQLLVTRSSSSQNTWVLYGGLLSHVGDTLPSGFPDAKVPLGKTSSTISGAFHSQLGACAGNKTLPFKDVSAKPGILLSKSVTTENGACPGQTSLNVAKGDEVKFCFQIQNTGTTKLIDITLNDLTLGVDLTDKLDKKTLDPGESAYASYEHVAQSAISNTAVAAAKGGVESTDTASATVFFCGDGKLDRGEACDDGNNNETDGCTSKCQCGPCGCGVPSPDSDGDGTPDCLDGCPRDPKKTNPGICGCGVADTDTDGDGVADCYDACPEDPNKARSAGECGCGYPDIDKDGDGYWDAVDLDGDNEFDPNPYCNDTCPADPDKNEAGKCGCGIPDIDSDKDGTLDCKDLCPNDPYKTEPGECGCGYEDKDTDGDGVADCQEDCSEDPNKTNPGICGCGVSDEDSDGDRVPDCYDACPKDPKKARSAGECGCGFADVDKDGDGYWDSPCQDPDVGEQCPDDPEKSKPGLCGCGKNDFDDSDNDGTVDCKDLCPDDPSKIEPGICDCGVADIDSDGDGWVDCAEFCPFDPNKTEPGICGCGVADVDGNGDGTIDQTDCLDECPYDPSKNTPGLCGCGVEDTDSDCDGTPDCNDLCPDDPSKVVPGVCGCGVADKDNDGDGTLDCQDQCPDDKDKTCPGICGCNESDEDSDSDGTPDCNDLCPDDLEKVNPGICGCGVSDKADADGDGVPDCIDDCPQDPDKTEPGDCGCGVPEDPFCGVLPPTPTPTATPTPTPTPTPTVRPSATPTATPTARPSAGPSINPLLPPDCDTRDITHLLFSLDGVAAEQKEILDGALKRLNRYARTDRRLKAFVGATSATGARLYADSWNVVWSIDKINFSCPPDAGCLAVSNSKNLDQYDQNAKQLLVLTRQAVRKLRQKKGKKKFGKKILVQAQKAYAKGLAEKDQVPGTSDVCGAKA